MAFYHPLYHTTYSVSGGVYCIYTQSIDLSSQTEWGFRSQDTANRRMSRSSSGSRAGRARAARRTAGGVSPNCYCRRRVWQHSRVSEPPQNRHARATRGAATVGRRNGTRSDTLGNNSRSWLYFLFTLRVDTLFVSSCLSYRVGILARYTIIN